MDALRKCIVRLVVAALCALAVGAQAPVVAKDSVRLVFFDVGQGDAAMITTPDGKNILIDAGPSGAHIVPQLDAFGIHTIDLVIASHNHADHIGGMPDVLTSRKVLAYMDNGVVALTRAYRRTVDAVSAHEGISVLHATTRLFQAGTVAIRILAPSHRTESQNDNSIGVWVQFGAFNAVFCGDAERQEIAEWLAGYAIEPASVVKVSHHGSANGTTPEWVKALSPKLVVFSVGPNQYGHPAAEVVAAWAGAGARLYRTDSTGTVTITAAKDGGFRVLRTRGSLPVAPQ